MTDQLLMQILELVIMVVLGLVTAYVVPYMKSKITKDQMEVLLY